MKLMTANLRLFIEKMELGECRISVLLLKKSFMNLWGVNKQVDDVLLKSAEI